MNSNHAKQNRTENISAKKISLLHQQMCKYINPGDILILLTNIWNIIKGGFRGGIAAPKIISNKFFLLQYFYYFIFIIIFFFFLQYCK